jgi:hypothetical protein
MFLSHGKSLRWMTAKSKSKLIRRKIEAQEWNAIRGLLSDERVCWQVFYGEKGHHGRPGETYLTSLFQCGHKNSAPEDNILMAIVGIRMVYNKHKSSLDQEMRLAYTPKPLSSHPKKRFGVEKKKLADHNQKFIFKAVPTS